MLRNEHLLFAVSIEKVLQIVKEFLDLGGSGALVQAVVQLAQQLFLFLGESCGGLHHHSEPVVATAAGVIYLGDTLIPQDELSAGLGAFGDGIGDLSVQSGNLNLRAQSRLGEGNGNLAQHVRIPAAEDGMVLMIGMRDSRILKWVAYLD